MNAPYIDKPEKLGYFFYRFLFSKALTSVTTTAFTIYFMWVIVVRSHSVFLSGLIITIYLAIQLIFSIPIGHMIDRVNNTILNFISSFIIVISYAVLLLNNNILAIYIVTAVSILGQTLKTDSFSAIIKKFLKEKAYKKAISLNFLTGSVTSILGAIIGGAFLIYFSDYFIFVIIFMVLISLFSSIPVMSSIQQVNGNSISFSGEMKSVGLFLKRISGFLLLAFFLNGLFISIDTYSSGLFNIVLKTNPIYYTAFNMAVPIGMMVGTPLVNTGYFKVERPALISKMIFIFTPFLIILSLSKFPIIDILDAFVIGLMLPLINIPLNSRLIKVIPREIYGKTSAVMRIFVQGASPVMGAVFNILAIRMSIQSVFLYVAFLVIPLAIYGMKIIPKFFESDFSQKELNIQ